MTKEKSIFLFCPKCTEYWLRESYDRCPWCKTSLIEYEYLSLMCKETIRKIYDLEQAVKKLQSKENLNEL